MGSPRRMLFEDEDLLFQWSDFQLPKPGKAKEQCLQILYSEAAVGGACFFFRATKRNGWNRQFLGTSREPLPATNIQVAPAKGSYPKGHFLEGNDASELCLEVTREHLRAAGITLDDRGGVKLEQVLQKGQELAKTEDQVYPMFFFSVKRGS